MTLGNKIIRLFKVVLTTWMLVVWGSLDAQELKVISFNIRYNPYYLTDGENGWEYRRDAVVQMIRQEEPAVIGLQEALLDQLLYLDSHLTNYRRVGVGRDDGRNEGEFMAIYFNIDKIELLSTSTRWLSTTPERVSKGWDAACKRVVTYAHFRDKGNGKDFYYFNTHLDHIGRIARIESVKLIASMIKEKVSENTPVILGGDMNSSVEDSIFGGFYSCRLKAARDLTWRSSNAITYNAFGKSKGTVIDHFFVRGMKVRRFRTLNRSYGVPYISDHYPIAMTVVL